MTNNFSSSATCKLQNELSTSKSDRGLECITFSRLSFSPERVCTNNDKISGLCRRVESVETPDDKYDFMVVRVSMTYEFTSQATCNADFLGPSLADVCSASTYLVFMSLLNACVRNNDKISGLCRRVEPVETPDDKYDFIVVGGGAAGSVVAARLSEIHDWKVLLLEAGPEEPAGTEVPGFAFTFLGTEIIWDYKTKNESEACRSTNGSCAWPSGKNLGGNTVHNAMIYLRGNPTDYNNWADQGNEGWTWEEVEPFFIKSEDNGEIDRVGREHHGTGGPLSVERFPYMPSIGRSILAAAEEAGFGVSEDLNGDKVTGFSHIQATNKKGVRRSSASAFLRPARHRRNLHVSLNSTVTRVIVENDTAVGVEYHKDGELKSAYVTREVVISGGAMEAPHILLLSGIGPKEHLESVGVEVVKDLPGVGENLQDHPGAIIDFTVNDDDTYDNDWAVAAEYLEHQTGPLSSVGTTQSLGLLTTNATAPDFPDIELYIVSHVPGCGPGEIDALKTKGKRTVTVLPSYLHPKSRGKVTLASNNPFDLPVIWANYLGEPEDLDRMIDGAKMGLALLDTEALRGYNFTLTASPACVDYKLQSDEYWACVIQQNNYALYHLSGTCKMGPSSDPMAVVDPRLRVHGIKGLRVADASIMPQVTSSNTAAPTMMIGERAADFIKKDWGIERNAETNQPRSKHVKQ